MGGWLRPGVRALEEAGGGGSWSPRGGMGYGGDGHKDGFHISDLIRHKPEINPGSENWLPLEHQGNCNG